MYEYPINNDLASLCKISSKEGAVAETANFPVSILQKYSNYVRPAKKGNYANVCQLMKQSLKASVSSHVSALSHPLYIPRLLLISVMNKEYNAIYRVSLQ